MSKKQPSIPVEAKVEELGPCHQKVFVKVPAARVTQEFEHAISAAGRGVKVPGFRPGKVPLEMLRSMLGDGIEEDARQHLFEHILPETIAQLRLKMLRLVDFDPSKFEVVEGQDLAFEYELETAPVIELPNWDEIEVENRVTEPDEEQIQRTLAAIGKEHPRFDPVETEVMDADTMASCDIAFSKEGEEGPTANDLKLALGSPLYGTDEKAYEEALTGAKSGDELTLEVDFMEGFEIADWVGQKGKVKISIKGLVAPRPGTPSEIAEDMKLENEEKFLEMVKERLEMDNTALEMRRQVGEALEAILEQSPFDLPARLVEEEAEHAEKGAVERLKQDGKDEAKAQKEISKKSADIRRDAERRLRNYFLIRRIAAAEKVRVSKNDLDQAYREIGMRNGTDVKTTRDFYREKGLESQLREDILETKTRAKISRILATRHSPEVSKVESAATTE